MTPSNSSKIAGYNIIKSLALVSHNVVQSKHLGRDIMVGLKTIIGGETVGYTEMLTDTRELVQKRMIEQAKKFNAKAIIIFVWLQVVLHKIRQNYLFMEQFLIL